MFSNSRQPRNVMNASESRTRMSVEMLETRRLLTTLLVDAVGDLDDGNLEPGQVTLREAISVANFVPGPDEIVFDVDGVFATAQRIDVGGELEITDSLTIAGPGADRLTLDANGTSRIFNMNSTDSEFAIQGLTLTGGVDAHNHGAAIRLTAGDLVVEESVITGNHAQRYGGGIYAMADTDLTVKRSTISNNSASWGGGILSYGQSMVDHTTISGNSASAGGGGLYIADALIANSTIAHNVASVGGGIDLDGFVALTIENSILASNSDSYGLPDLRVRYGSTVSASYSLVGDASSAVISGAGNIVGDSMTGVAVDPLLTPLEYFGGPMQTHGLLEGSPARNAADPAVQFDATNFDQRGSMFFRVQEGRMDMGAHEDLPVELTVDNGSDVFDGVVSSGELSLREAVELANLDPGQNTISFDTSGAFAGPSQIDLGNGELVLTESTSFNGPGADRLTIDAGGNSRILNITAMDGDFVIDGLTLTGADAGQGQGGAVQVLGGDLLVLDSWIVGNAASDLSAGRGYGGGVYASDAAGLTVRNSTVSGNSGRFGGGIMALADLAVENSTVSGNSAIFGGGGIFGVNAGIRNSTITNNESAATRGGAGIEMTSNAGATLVLESSIVAGNSTVGGNYRPDLDPYNAALTVRYTLVGDADGVLIAGSGNIIGDSSGAGVIDPQLGSLADNGGATPTHALLPGSFAVDEGDRFAVAGAGDVPLYDQRGEGFTRVHDGRMDMGAFEVQPATPCALAGDLDCSGPVGASDVDLVLSNWGVDSSVAGVPAGWVHDLPDGVIGAEELDNVLAHWGNSAAAAAPLAHVQRPYRIYEYSDGDNERIETDRHELADPLSVAHGS